MRRNFPPVPRIGRQDAVRRTGRQQGADVRKILFVVVFFGALLLMLFSAPTSTRNQGPFLVDCKALSLIVGIDHLSLFERVNGTYQINKKKFRLQGLGKHGWPNVVIPAYDYDSVQRFSDPFEGIKFSVKKKDINVVVFSRTHATLRRHLSTVISEEVYRAYGTKPLFSLLDNSLGINVDESRFCAGDPEKAVGMFMASVVLPVSAGSTQVYRLVNPDGLLLVRSSGSRTTAKLIFPGARDIDTIDYVLVDAPEAVSVMLDALEKVGQ